MRNIIIYISLFWLFGCKKETKKNAEKLDGIIKVEDSIGVEEGKQEHVKLKHGNFDYSLKPDEVKTQNDSVLFLKYYFNQYIKGKDSLSEVLFFNMFPDNFKEFKALYGYDESQNEIIYGGLYDDYGQIIDYEPKYVEKQDYIEKLISLSIRGNWQSDNVAHLQNKVNELFLKNPIRFIEILKHKRKLEIESFWVFFFDGPRPENQQEMYNTVISSLMESDSTMVPIAERAYTKVKEDWQLH
ncbi:hypothetical protein B4Q04_14615 [Zobellia sp. OII3]|uniref:hypothetical protein n=1 Tax=Zobellia sp. OII3 TaxID=2034520 RepID=UPI000B52D899|nr:hypothetical protein [Zobellia sp. OII3]OWW24547.1 hypothetical protein B4Q04_14615 [Zobellia sp. OII3]